MLRMSRSELEALKARPAKVECGSCSACCTRDRVFLGPADACGQYREHVETDPAGREHRVLDRKLNGDCNYLTAAGCGIHGAAPDVCRRMDCRVLYLLTPVPARSARAEQNPQMAKIYAAAVERLGVA